jgi:WD40 repeat protein
MRILEGHRRPPQALAFAPHDPATLASAAEDGDLFVWDVPLGRRRRKFNRKNVSSPGLAFSPDGRTLLLGSLTHDPRLLDVAEGRWGVGVHWSGARLFAFAPDGSHLAGDWSAHYRGQRPQHGIYFQRWPRHPGGLPVGHAILPGRVAGLAFGPDGRALAVACADGEVRLFRVPELGEVDRQQRRPQSVPFALRGGWGVGGEPTALLFLRQGEGGTVAVAVGKGVELRDMAAKGRRRLGGHDGRVAALAATPDGKRLLSGTDAGEVRLWDAEGEQRAAYDPGLGPVRALAFAPDGMTAAVAGANRHDIVVFDVEAD